MLVSNLILGALFASFVAFHFATERAHVADRKSLVNAILARNPQEFMQLQKPVPVPRADAPDPERIFAEGF